MSTPRRASLASKSDSHGEEEETYMSQRPIRKTRLQKTVMEMSSEEDDDVEEYTPIQTSSLSKEEREAVIAAQETVIVVKDVEVVGEEHNLKDSIQIIVDEILSQETESTKEPVTVQEDADLKNDKEAVTAAAVLQEIEDKDQQEDEMTDQGMGSHKPKKGKKKVEEDEAENSKKKKSRRPRRVIGIDDFPLDQEIRDESSYGDEEFDTSEESLIEVMGLVFQQPQTKGSSTSKEVEVVTQEKPMLEERFKKMLAKDLIKEEEEDYINMFKRNETLKKDLHLKAYSTFEQVMREALYLVDNCKAYGEVSEDAESMASGTSSVKSDTSIKKDLPAAPTTKQMIEEITKRIQQQMKNPIMRYPQMRKCDICGRDHPTPWCTQQPKAPIATGRVFKWCAVEQKWTNHATEECYYNKDYVRGRSYGPPAGPPQPPPPRYQVGPNVNTVAGADRSQPVLGQKPPLPHKNSAMIRYTQPYEAPQPMSNAPMLTYYEEPSESYISEPEQPMYAEEPYQSWEMNEGMAQSSYVAQPSRDQYLVDERTLMFVANQNYKPRGYPNRERQPMGPLPPNQQPIGPCFNCGSPDHWERSCPHKGQRVKIYGFCSDCGIKHILPKCPRNPDNKGKTTLNKVGVLPSASSGSKTEPVVQVNVVTRAQAKELEIEKPMEENARVSVPTENGSLSVRTQRKSWKAKHERMKARRAQSQTAIQEKLQEVKQQLQQELESKKVEQKNQPRKASSGGSVLVDKVLEPLDALLQQWEARLNNTQTLEKRWLTYPYPKIETKWLEMCKDLIRAAQALMEPNIIRAPEQEVLIQREIEKQSDKKPETVMKPKPDTNLPLEHRVVPKTTDEAMTMEVMPVPEVEEPWPQSLWETIRNRKDRSAT
ncbi:hypothetical protein L7F22_065418 [Adiantum nelumboides]|nr:hypothetical protein [Adiantum nelumboides]